MANKKITDLTAAGAVDAANDLIAIVQDVSTTPVTKKISIEDLIAGSGATPWILSGTTIQPASGSVTAVNMGSQAVSVLSLSSTNDISTTTGVIYGGNLAGTFAKMTVGEWALGASGANTIRLQQDGTLTLTGVNLTISGGDIDLSGTQRILRLSAPSGTPTSLLAIDSSGNIVDGDSLVSGVYVPFSGGTITGNLSVNGNTILGDAGTDTLTIAPSAVTWSNNPTHSGNHTFSGNLTVNGNTILGDASGDTLTINATTYLQTTTHVTGNGSTGTAEGVLRVIGGTPTGTYSTPFMSFDNNNSSFPSVVGHAASSTQDLYLICYDGNVRIWSQTNTIYLGNTSADSLNIASQTITASNIPSGTIASGGNLGLNASNQLVKAAVSGGGGYTYGNEGAATASQQITGAIQYEFMVVPDCAFSAKYLNVYIQTAGSALSTRVAIYQGTTLIAQGSAAIGSSVGWQTFTMTAESGQSLSLSAGVTYYIGISQATGAGGYYLMTTTSGLSDATLGYTTNDDYSAGFPSTRNAASASATQVRPVIKLRAT